MLGRVRRTTRTDVALALILAGLVYLAWALACWSAKRSAAYMDHQAMASATYRSALPAVSRGFVKTFSSWTGGIFDLIGPVWMLLGLYMVIRASRQRRIISWSWLLISCQAVAALLIACWAAVAMVVPTAAVSGSPAPRAPMDWSPAVIAVAVLIWFGTLVWLILERIRYGRFRSLTAIRDGFKTHAYRR